MLLLLLFHRLGEETSFPPQVYQKKKNLSPEPEPLLLLFMPTEPQSQVEYYHYYRASQRRVQQWVQNTSRELEAGSSTTTTAAGKSSDLPLIIVGEGKDGNGTRRRSSSSSSKPQIHDQVDSSRSRGPSSRSRSTRKKAKKINDVRSRKPYSSDGLTTSSLLSLGLFPLIFVLTPPSVATLFSATILLAGYFSVDYSASVSIIHKFYLFLRLIYFISFRRKGRSLRNCDRRGKRGIG